MKQNMFVNYKKTNYEQYHFGNEWGLFVDIENTTRHINYKNVTSNKIIHTLAKIEELLEDENEIIKDNENKNIYMRDICKIIKKKHIYIVCIFGIFGIICITILI
jgi:hypothetical protein